MDQCFLLNLQFHFVSFILIALFHYYFPLAMCSPNSVFEWNKKNSSNLSSRYISLLVRTTNCPLYSNISQILLLYETWGYYNKFDSMKSLGVYYWYVKMPRCGCVEHGLECITFYVKKYIAPLAVCYGPTLVRDRPLRHSNLWDSLIAWLWANPVMGWLNSLRPSDTYMRQ